MNAIHKHNGKTFFPTEVAAQRIVDCFADDGAVEGEYRVVEGSGGRSGQFLIACYDPEDTAFFLGYL